MITKQLVKSLRLLSGKLPDMHKELEDVQGKLPSIVQSELRRIRNKHGSVRNSDYIRIQYHLHIRIPNNKVTENQSKINTLTNNQIDELINSTY